MKKAAFHTGGTLITGAVESQPVLLHSSVSGVTLGMEGGWLDLHDYEPRNSASVAVLAQG